MNTFTGGGFVLAAALTVAAPYPRGSFVGPAFEPGDGMPNAVVDDGRAVHSMAEGGTAVQPFVVDGTVQQVTEHSVLVESRGLGGEHLYVSRHTAITLDGRDASLAELRPGMRIRAAYRAAGTAQALEAEDGEPAGRG